MQYDEVLKEVGNGKVFGAVFQKTDGSERVMSARVGVRKDLKGVGHKFSCRERNLLSVFDMNKKEYRFINLNTCSRIRANGKEIS